MDVHFLFLDRSLSVRILRAKLLAEQSGAFLEVF